MKAARRVACLVARCVAGVAAAALGPSGIGGSGIGGVPYIAAVVVGGGKGKKAYFLNASMVSKEPKESFPEKRNSQWYSQKLSELRARLGLSQAVMAKKLGVSGAAIGQLERGESKSPSADLLGALASMLSVNLDWLLNGEGEMLKSEQPAHNSTARLADGPRVVAVAEGDNTGAPIYNLRTTANYLGAGLSQERPEPDGVITLPSWLLRRGDHAVFPVIGDSMEPTFFARDYVLCRFLPSTEWEHLREDTVAVIVSESRGLQLKRITCRTAERHMRCKSDSSSHPYYQLDLEDVLEVWQFEWRITSNSLNPTEGLSERVSTVEDSLEDMRALLEQVLDKRELHRREA